METLFPFRNNFATFEESLPAIRSVPSITICPPDDITFVFATGFSSCFATGF